MCCDCVGESYQAATRPRQNDYQMYLAASKSVWGFGQLQLLLS